MLLGLASLSWACQAKLGDNQPTISEESEGHKLFIAKVIPAMQTANCIACHAVDPFPFFRGVTDHERYLALTASDVINFATPASSRLITKGSHAGRALMPDETSTVLDWLKQEQTDRTGTQDTTLVASARIKPKLCVSEVDCPSNELDLSAAGSVGSKLTFTYEELSDNLVYITDFTFIAGTQGLYVDHPLFVSIDGKGTDDTVDDVSTVDPADTLFDVKENLQADATATPHGGIVSMPFPKGRDLQVMFKRVAPYQIDNSGKNQGGCKHVDLFVANAKAQLTPRCAPACHTGTAAGSGAMQLNGINTDDMAMLTQACNQALSCVNRSNRDQSGLFFAPTPGQGNHPLKLNDANELAAYKAALLVWINKELE